MFQDIDIDLSRCLAIGSDGMPCSQPTSRIDGLGLPWCEDCEYRGEFLEWGLAHNFPALEAKENGIAVYVIAEGVYYWTVTALYATEDRVLLLIAASEDYRQLELAS